MQDNPRKIHLIGNTCYGERKQSAFKNLEGESVLLISLTAVPVAMFLLLKGDGVLETGLTTDRVLTRPTAGRHMTPRCAMSPTQVWISLSASLPGADSKRPQCPAPNVSRTARLSEKDTR